MAVGGASSTNCRCYDTDSAKPPTPHIQDHKPARTASSRWFLQTRRSSSPSPKQGITRWMSLRWLAIAGAIVVLTACNGVPASGPHPSSRPSTAASKSGCSPSPADRSTSGGAPELRGTVSPDNSLWALIIGPGPPIPVAPDVKIVWRMTGTGPITLEAEGPHSRTVKPDWGPDYHPSSNWSKPGREWGAGFTFPVVGCWTVRAARSSVVGYVVLWVGK
jgi:hypothetical protein